MSEKGIHGEGIFFNRFCISWTSPVIFSSIAQAFQGKPSGVTVLELDVDGIPTFHSLLLPHAITSTEDFQNALRAYAPINHSIFGVLNVAT